MAARSYPRLGIEDFGRQLLETGDLDPIYVALHGMQMGHEQLSKWLIAYWCMYSAGVASWMSERADADFWPAMMVAAVNTAPTPCGGRWERGKERRHFRGGQGVKAIEELSAMYPNRPAEMVDVLIEPWHQHWGRGSDALTAEEVIRRAKTHRSFGDWMSFKVADMVETVLGEPVIFDEAEIFMFDSPRQAAIMVADQTCPIDTTVEAKIKYAVARLELEFRGMKAPPRFERHVGLQEIETILCKWKSHQNGHYPVGNDIHEISEGVKPWLPHCPTAAAFLKHMPRMPA